jgi:hypothetical protein
MTGHVTVNDNTAKISISKFGSYFSKAKNKVVPGGKPSDTDFYTEMLNIKQGYYRSIIDELKSIKGPDEQKRFKESKLPSFSISCRCKDWRKEENIISHSGLLNIDVDGEQNLHIDDWNEMRDRLSEQLPTIVSCFISARGNGLSFVVKIKPDKHRETYNSVGFHLQKSYNIYIDPSCKNPTRLRFVSYDPDAYINFDFDSIPVVIPSKEYIDSVKQLPKLSLLSVTKANSKELFENAIHFTESKYQSGQRLTFKDGMKYWYLITLAGYCNSHGMDADYCKQMVTEKFSPLTSDDIIRPVEDIYKSYQHQFATIPFNDQEAEILRDKLRIDLYEDIAPSPSVIEVFYNDEFLRFATLGNFSMIIGKAKSRKTFFISMIAASFLRGVLFMDKLIRRFTANKTKLIVFDTEQGRYDVQQLAKKIMRLSSMDHNTNIEVYHLRTLDTKQRIEFIENVLYNTSEICMAVIDGIRDLVYDINSPEEATHIATKLLKWSEELDIHILTVLHQNKNDANGRGHLGTELTNKAESVLSIAKDQKVPDFSVVTPEYFRGKEFGPFAFKIGENGLPFIVDDFNQPSQDQAGKRVINANNIPDITHRGVLIEVFSMGARQKYSDLITQIKLSFQAYGMSFGVNKAKEFFTYYKNNGWIKENTDREPGEKTLTYSSNKVV